MRGHNSAVKDGSKAGFMGKEMNIVRVCYMFAIMLGFVRGKAPYSSSFCDLSPPPISGPHWSMPEKLSTMC